MHKVQAARPARWLFRSLAVAYVIATLPLLLLFLWNPTCHHTFLNLAAHYRSKFDPVRTVHLGNSLTAGGGGHWSTLIGGYPLDAYNLAVAGSTIRQMKSQAEKAVTYSPEWICMLGGTNDVSDPRYDVDSTASEFETILSIIESAEIPCLVTLVPYQSQIDRKQRIDDLNKRIREIAEHHRCEVLDLNPRLAPEGRLLPEYTTDGLHFTPAAYEVWGAEIARKTSGDR